MKMMTSAKPVTRGQKIARALAVIVGSIVLLAGLLVAHGFLRIERKAHVESTRATLSAVQQMIALYRADCQMYPSERQGLEALVRNPSVLGWDGPYLRGGVPLDSWSRQLHYRLLDGKPLVESAGRDGVFGTGDDILEGTPIVERGGGR